MMTKMANTSVHIPWKYNVIFKPFDVSFLVFILITLGMVTAQHLPNDIEHNHHHSNHVCKHQHPKADDVRSINKTFIHLENWKIYIARYSPNLRGSIVRLFHRSFSY